MLAIVRDAIDNGPYPLARETPVQRKDGAYQKAFEVKGHMVPQVREVLHRPMAVNIPVTAVSSTLAAAFREVFLEDMHSLISPRRFPCANHQLANNGLVEKFHPNLDRFDVRHVFVHLPHQMHYSCRSLAIAHAVVRDTVSEILPQLLLLRIHDMLETTGFRYYFDVVSSFLEPLASGRLP